MAKAAGSASEGGIKPTSFIFLAERRFPGSTEGYLVAELDLSEFWIALGAQDRGGEPVGYAKFVRREHDEVILGRSQGTFELQEVRPASAPSPCPIISLSGVLWTRPAAIEAHQVISSFQAATAEGLCRGG